MRPDAAVAVVGPRMRTRKQGKCRLEWDWGNMMTKKPALSFVLCLVSFLPLLMPPQQSRPASADKGDELLSMGLLDVTKGPYFADPEGERDSTEAIRRAVNDARDKGLVCFFPLGSYLISDTISCEQENYRLDTPRFVDGHTAYYWHKNHKIIMLGSTRGGKRPVLKLSRNAKGFDDPASPKIAIWIWARTWFGDGTGEQPNISFGHYFMGIDIDVRGHSGAIGLKHSGSQGCTLQDSTIHAEGAFSGLYNCPGQAAGTYNVEVIGGDYGFYADSQSRFPILIGCRFRNQVKAAIGYAKGGTQVPTLLIACLVESSSGAVIDLTAAPRYAGVSMVDCVLRMNGGVVALTTKKENVFLQNTYVRGAESVLSGGTKIEPVNRWTLVERFSAHTEESVNLINGKESSDEHIRWKAIDSEPDYGAIVGRHWTRRPSFEDDDAVNIKSFGAKGDGAADDTRAFERAISSHDKIFVPPGDYRLTGNLKLRNNTQVYSLSSFLTSIGAPRGPREAVAESGSDSFTLSTPDDAAASPGLWFVAIAGRVNWMSGRGISMHARAPYRFSGNAGGKLHALIAMGEQFLVENTYNPLAFYSLNVERVTRNPQSIIRNSKKVRIYYFKVEAGTRNMGDIGGGDENIPGCIENSEDVKVYCMYGNVKGLSRDRAMLEIINSRDIMVAQLKAFFPGVFPHVKETIGSETHTIPSSRICALYLRD